MALIMRPYSCEEDYWRIRDFLRSVFLMNGRTEHSWNVARLDYWRWHVVPNCGVCPQVEEVVYIWENGDGGLAAVLNPEGMGEAFLQVDPDQRTPELEEEMVSLAEEKFAVKKGRKRKLCFMVEADDTPRQGILSARGYRRGGFRECARRLRLTSPVTPPRAPEGWTIRHQRPEDIPSRSWASWKAFHPEDPEDGYEGYDWYYSLERIPLYRRDLDMVAVGPDGEVGGFCTVWYDDVTRTGYFEPVGRKPDVEVHGLMRVLLLEACRRLRNVGGDLATVGGSSFPANTLYYSVFGPHHQLVENWVREW